MRKGEGERISDQLNMNPGDTTADSVQCRRKFVNYSVHFYI